jgi:uncharacterized protein (DUF924 family)
MNRMNSEQSTGAQAVLDFWFGTGTSGVRGISRKEWFRKDVAFDDEIRRRFLPLYERAATGELAHWENDACECLALIVVLDQFPRNMFRGSGRAFAADHLARAATAHAVEHGYDRDLLPVERMFVYLPLEHSELLVDQERCLALMKQLAPYPETGDLHVWAEKHRVIIERFGRFPHRNAALGRESTPQELEFLEQPGSGF